MEILRSVASTSSSALNSAVSMTGMSSPASASLRKQADSKDDTDLRRTVSVEDDEDAEKIRQQALSPGKSSDAEATTDDIQRRGSFCGQTACGSVSVDDNSISSYGEDDDGALHLPFNQHGAPHSWSHCLSRTFKVRSKTYWQDKKKVESGAYLFPARGAELLLTEACPENVASNDNLLHGTIRDVPSFIVNFRFPWGVLILAFEIPAKYVPFLEYRNAKGSAQKTPPSISSSFSPAERRAARFLMSSDVDIAASLKLIPVATEGPWLVRNLVTGTPVIIGNKVKTRIFRGDGEAKPVKASSHSPTQTSTSRRAPYLELDLDIGESIKPRAKKIVSMCRTHMASLNINIGFVVQGDTAEELPEQMLAALSLNRIDPQTAPQYPSSDSRLQSRRSGAPGSRS